MKIWHILGILIEAIVLMEVLLGKDVTTSDGTCLGIAIDIELDLMWDKIWVIVEHQGQWNRIPSKQISSLTDKVTLVEGWLPAMMS